MTASPMPCSCIASAAAHGSRNATAISILIEIPDDSCDIRQDLPYAAPRSEHRLPEDRPVIEIEDRQRAGAPRHDGRQDGCSTRLLTEAGDGHPENSGSLNRLVVEVLRSNLEIRSLRSAIEVEREVVGWKYLAERHRRRLSGDGGDVTIVDSESAERIVDELPERVSAGTADDRRAAVVAGGGDRDICRAAAKVLPERFDIAQCLPRLQGVQVNAGRAPSSARQILRWCASRRL